MKPKPKPKKQKRTKLGPAPNMQAAANRTGYPFEMLSEAKNLGCSAFTLRGSVDCDAFVEWLEAPDQVAFREKWDKEGAIPTRETSKRIKEHYDAMEAKRKHEEKTRKLIARNMRVQQFETFCAGIMADAEALAKTPAELALFCQAIQKRKAIFVEDLQAIVAE